MGANPDYKEKILVANMDTQAAFRLAQSRAELAVDSLPSETAVWQYSQVLLAEAETLQLAQSVSTLGVGTTGSAAKVKAMTAPGMGGQASSTPSPGAGRVCRSWGSDAGCKYGRACKFEHPVLQDRSERCWVCSAKDHRKSECPVKDSCDFRALGGSAGGSSGKDDKGKGKGKGKTKAKQPTKSEGGSDASLKAVAGSTTTTTSSPGKDQGEEDGQKGGASSASADSGEALIAEVTHLLKSIRPKINAVRLRRLDNTGESTMLLDGGATHCLRCAKDDQEWQDAEVTTVQLAAGSIQLRQDKESGTLLTLDRAAQPIIPLVDLTRIGVEIAWTTESCRMVRADGRVLPTHLDGGCPVISKKEGEKLMQEIEAYHRHRCGLRRVYAYTDASGDGLCGEEDAKRCLELKAMFPNIPAYIAERIPGTVDFDVNKIPLNRRQRKRVEEATTLVLHVFSGKNTRAWTSMEGEGLVILCVELEKGANLLNDDLYGWLESLARRGKFDLMIGGPPCRSVSLQRHRGDGGPRPVRGRYSGYTNSRFGLPTNDEREQKMVDEDTTLWMRFLWLIYLRRMGNPACEAGIEQPEDPELWLPPWKPRPSFGYASFLSWEETHTVMGILGMQAASFDQGALGHQFPKPTTVISNSEELIGLDGTRITDQSSGRWTEELSNQGTGERPADLEERMKASKAAAQWSPGLIQRFQEAICRVKGKSRFVPKHGEVRADPEKYRPFLEQQQRARERLGLPPLPIYQEFFGLRMMNAKEKDEQHLWQLHVNSGHQPYRRDCKVCLESMGRDRPRKRMVCPDSYVLTADVAGPFRTGRDQDGNGKKYMFVAAYTVPSTEDTPLVKGLRDLGGLPPLEEQWHHEELHSGDGIPYDVGEIGDQRKLLEEESPTQEEVKPVENPQLEPGEPEDRDPLAEFPEEPVPLTPVEIQECDLADQEWKKKIIDLKNVKVNTLTFAIPIRSRHATEIVAAMSEVYTRLRSMALPILRFHSDRAKEFISHPVKRWLSNRDILRTTTAADEPQGSGRAEVEVQNLKAQVRLTLKASSSPDELWPLALWHVAEARCRAQLLAMGIQLPRLLPFGVKALARSKLWHKRQQAWQYPMQEVTIYGPALGMSASSKGYFLKAGNRWLRSTVVIVPKEIQLPEPQLPVQVSPGDYEPTTPGGEAADEDELILDELQPLQKPQGCSSGAGN